MLTPRRSAEKAVFNLNEFENLARRYLPRAIFGYVQGGADDGSTIAHNRRALDRLRMVPRVLRDVSSCSQQVTLFGQGFASPFMIAPMGASAIIGPDADNAMARAARSARIPYILSANAITPLEEIGRTYPGCWFAGYQKPDESNIERMLGRVADAGFSAYFLTADVAVGSNRENNRRNGYTMPFRPTARLALDLMRHPFWLYRTGWKTFRQRGMPRISNIDPVARPSIFSREISAVTGYAQFSWKHAEMIRRRWKGAFVIKGILSPEDARLAREMGADGIVVSNHGGRQLDCAVSPVETLARIRDVSGGMTLLVDSGFRRGTDIIKGLAMGADGVLIGRPFLYAAALGGEPALRHAINLLQREIHTDMCLMGVADCHSLREQTVISE
ncbi:alpha-hydroxy acid oxidase [Swaminathania salitolerans]|uniref:Alpha-hydroxy-acid oxidizing enzyme n=1 Tax=Swaminathania salitolerans TaxID=182838 RepID=A0A511BPQ6_9PROT|nr:alpha-hydroxy acid oxidase [Swaminathania salitolerans]GBQ11106.1 L-lactate dehydrogenase [Swaminathania salitolerans LMG 21291]GEL02311.1 alpha-hydroxy-acid oxidizing enzyme [Swaminathania salitolerans]